MAIERIKGTVRGPPECGRDFEEWLLVFFNGIEENVLLILTLSNKVHLNRVKLLRTQKWITVQLVMITIFYQIL